LWTDPVTTGLVPSILLDFDGPVCSIFARLTAQVIAAELRQILTDNGTVVLPPEVLAVSDPLAVLQWTANHEPELTRNIDDELRQAELRAVKTAHPTPYAADVIVAAHRAARPVAIVSNNSELAIRAYLESHGLSRYIGPVIGRAYAEPDRMKPHPEPVLRAVSALNVEPQTCVLVGDSPNDIHATRNAGTRSVGYANKPGKRRLLVQAGADVVIDSMVRLATALTVED
jgi:HAD superfamily hydrolase (TIGR01509 family)